LQTVAQPPSLLISLISMNNREMLRRCLDSIPAACGPLRFDVSVVDNMSSDGSVEMLAACFPHARVTVNTARLGFSANHNQTLVPAMQRRSHDFVCILNDDTELDPGSLDALVRACNEDASIGMAGPVIRGPDGRRQPSRFRFPSLRREVVQKWLRRTCEVARDGWLNGSCLVLPIDVLRSVGPLDERFFLFYEDADLSRRVADRGLVRAVIPEATMVHHGHATIANPQFGHAMEMQTLRSTYLYFEKHHGRRYAATALLVARMAFLGRALRAAAVSTLRRRPDEGAKRDLMLLLARYDPRAPLAHEAGEPA
jgi:N-acetylglucosaminyl-diphospho-decaprenol L-rhamnosyltransferase